MYLPNLLNFRPQFAGLVSLLIPIFIGIASCTPDVGAAMENAIREGQAGTVVRLIEEKHSDPNGLLEHRQQYPLEMAADLGELGVVEVLLEKGADPDHAFGEVSPLWRAMNIAAHDVATTLVKAGARFDDSGPEGESALYFAVTDQAQALVKALLRRGADPNLGGLKENPLHAAAYTGHSEIILLLLQAGAFINGEDEFHETPLFHAVRGNAIPAIETLYENEANMNFENDIGETVMHEAVYHADSLTLVRLLEYGVEINHQDDAGDTPLHRAAEAGDHQKAAVLLEHGASKRLRNLQRQTPAEVAAKNGHQKVVELINAW